MYISQHALERMIERNLTSNDVMLTVEYGSVVNSKSNDTRVVLEIDGVCVVVTTGWEPCVITAFKKY
ncbi:DUF4258 domain-containing protein [Photobacterium phosphoreum]|uniref:DUF4258 domain-containing protein n=1 Tax=Photobacterium phosphoreum TaxID=659 RepID=UPI000D15323B|nr:hypothetical protein DAT36_18780 [Photobacterium phosphoreum]